MLNIQKIHQVFLRQGFTINSYIGKSDYIHLLNIIMPKTSIFDPDIAQQIWNQASIYDSYAQQVQIDAICKAFESAHMILKQRILQIQKQLRILQKQRHSAISSGNIQGSAIINRIDNDYKVLNEDKIQYEHDLRQVTQPFGIRDSLIKQRISIIQSAPGFSSVMYQQSSYFPQMNQDLRWIFYLTLIFGGIQIIIIYGKYDFLNLIVLACLLSIYLLNQFDKIFVRFTLLMLCLSQILDIVWLFLYGGQTWNPPGIGNNSSIQTPYLRFIVFSVVILIIIKLPLTYYLLQYRNLSPDQKYPVQIMDGAITFVLSSNRSNPISRGIQNSFQNIQNLNSNI